MSATTDDTKQSDESYDPKVRYALITGASKGIGLACTKALLEFNKELSNKYKYVVIGVGRNLDTLNKVSEQLNNGLKKDSEPNFIPISFDLSKTTELENDGLFKKIEKSTNNKCKFVHILINNAGYNKYNGGLIKTPEEDIYGMINVNILSLTLLCKQGLSRMINNIPSNKNNQCFLINIGSIAGHNVTRASSGFYCATKHYVRALTEGLRKEISENKDTIKQNIHVGLISPGIVKTAFWETGLGLTKEKADNFVNTKPHLFDQDIANAMMFIIKQGNHANVCDIIIRPRLQEI